MKISQFINLFISGHLAFTPHINRRPWRTSGKRKVHEQSLSGLWDFTPYDMLHDADDDLYLTQIDDQFKLKESCTQQMKMPWPGQWELNGFGHPIYLNQEYTWADSREELEPPSIPLEAIQLGVYKKTFTITDPQKRHLPVLVLEGFESAVWIFCDGIFIGYSNQGKNCNEFPLPISTMKGEHQLTILMTSLSSGSYLECQDMWRLSGAIRDISIIQVPEIELFDVKILSIPYLNAQKPPTTPDSRVKADIFIEAKIWNHQDHSCDPQQIKAELYQKGNDRLLQSGEGFTGNLSYRFEEKRYTEVPEKIEANIIGTVYIKLPVEDALLWHPEAPNLYTVRITNPKTEDVIDIDTGFRDIRIVDGVFYFNGQPLKIKGVNLHEFSSDKGRAGPYPPNEDFKLMKAANLNAVRAAHYGHADAFYKEADEMGMLVMDEANMESHGISYRRNVLPGNDPRWFAMGLDRIQAMEATHKNHVSIFSWSIGNELGWGECVQEYASYLRAKEDRRLIHKRQMNKVADFNSETYPRPEFIEDIAKEEMMKKPSQRKPFLATEYGHAMGNSLGDIARYHHIFNQYDVLVGGFLWEWCDHALLGETKSHGKRPLYGGDFNEKKHDGNFCIDGIVGSDRKPTSKLLDLRTTWSPFLLKINSIEKSGIKVTCKNDLCLHDTNSLYLNLDILRNGEETFTFAFPCPTIAPEEKKTFQLKDDRLCRCLEETILESTGEEWLFRLSLRVQDTSNAYWQELSVLDADLAWTEYRYCGGYKHLDEIPFLKTSARKRSGNLSPEIITKDDELETIKMGQYQLDFCCHTGLLKCLSSIDSTNTKTKKRFFEDLDLCLARAVTDNDRRSLDYLGTETLAKWLPNNTTLRPGWKALDLHHLRINLACPIEIKDNKIIIRRSLALPDQKPWSIDQIYALHGSALSLKTRLKRPEEACFPLPRIGLSMKLKPSLNSTTWYGSSTESYPDRRAAAKLGIWRATASKLFNQDYLKPQENGQRDNLRWMALGKNKKEVDLCIFSDQIFSFARQPWSTYDLEKTKHLWELEARTMSDWLYLDHKHAGLGNSSCGPETAQRYKLKKQSYVWTFMFYIPNQAMKLDELIREWQWTDSLEYSDPTEDLEYRDDDTVSLREKMTSRSQNENYYDPSDPDIKRFRGF